MTGMGMGTGAPRVAIVDYGMGNLYSVERACAHVGLDATITSTPADVLAADGVVLPGVGAMPNAMDVLTSTGLADALREIARRDTPLLGICLGMQLLMTHGSEFREHDGLGIVAGEVRRFPPCDVEGRPLKVPHIGWSAVCPPAGDGARRWNGSPLSSLSPGCFMYFVHSYYVVPADAAVIAATTAYGGQAFCSALVRDNIFACQFHPERSGPTGLALYRAFAQRLTGSR